MHGRDVMTAEVLGVFLEHSPAAAFLRDDAGVYLWVNQSYADLYGVEDPRSMVGRDVFAFDPPLLATVYLESDRDVLRTGTALRHTLPLTRRDGTGEATGHRFRVPLPDDRTGVGGIYTDVTELHRTRDEVRRHQARHTSLFERSGVALAVLATSGVLREVNPAFAALVGRTPESATDVPLHDLLGPEGVRALLRPGDRAPVATRIPVGVRLPDGSVRPAVASTTKEPDGLTHVLALQPLTAASGPGATTLSDQEARLLEMLALGVDNATIATRMHLSRQGLDYHIRRLRHRLKALTRVELISRAYAAGVLDPSSWPPRVTAGLRGRSG